MYLSQVGWGPGTSGILVSSRQRSDGFLCLLVSELRRLEMLPVVELTRTPPPNFPFSSDLDRSQGELKPS